MPRIIACVAVLKAAFLLAAPAQAGESLCGPRAAIVAALAGKYGEAIVFRGGHPTAPQVIEVFANPATGTFTVLVTGPTTSCVTASGVAAELVPFVAPAIGEPG